MYTGLKMLTDIFFIINVDLSCYSFLKTKTCKCLCSVHCKNYHNLGKNRSV